MELVVLICFLGAVPLGIATWYWSGPARIRRKLRSAPRVSIAEAPEGEVVRIDGRVTEGEALEAPLTGRRCVYYVAVVEEKGDAGDWMELARESRGVRFMVEDGTGRAIIDPEGARIDVDLDSTTQSGTTDDPTPREAAFLVRHRLKGAGLFFNRTLRYREGVFEIGEPIAVMCQPVREPDPDAASRTAGYRDLPPTRLRVGGSPAHPILLSDSRDVTLNRRRRR